MRKKIVAGNWKMNKTLDEGKQLTSEIVNMVDSEVTEDVVVVLSPPFIHLSSTAAMIDGSEKVFLGAQNCSEYDSGAYTGEISAEMLASAGASYVIIGHSERREYFNENNLQLSLKVKSALKQGLTPIFCCGEPLDIREDGTFTEYVTAQLTESLFGLDAADFSKLVLAYEPIWAIGTGKTATKDQAQDMHAAIRAHIATGFGEGTADATSILYGGSCNPSNAEELFSCPDVDGGLIGGASLKSRDFVDVIKSMKA